MLQSILDFIGFEETSPTKVYEERSDNYVSRPVCTREDSIILYGPKISPNRNSKEKYFEIVLHKPFTETLIKVYSLFRSESKEVAVQRFKVYKDIIPIYIKLTNDSTVSNLQRACDILSDHQTWSIAHMIAHMGLYQHLGDETVIQHLNDVDNSTGATPLMIALKAGNIRMVQSLVTLDCGLDTKDLDGNTIFHYAAESNKDIISILTSKTTSCLNSYNKQGYTPLHMACLSNMPDCVRALLIAGADVNLTTKRSGTTQPGIVRDVLNEKSKLHLDDMKHGGTPLHWAISREVIEALIDANCDVNAVNFDERTALHVMVIRERLECVVALLSRGAEPSMQDNEGNTPLHLAVKQTNLGIVQALIVFGTKLDLQNNLGYTARHTIPVELTNSHYDKILYILHAVGAKRCAPDIAGCALSCSANGDYDGVPPLPVPSSLHARDELDQMLTTVGIVRAAQLNSQHKQSRLLCLDGGGIRGLILVQLLLELEEVVERPIVHCFDWIAGTSTGGILALALASGKTLRECQKLYFSMKEYAFLGKRPYPSEPLENALKECLGTETVMSDIKNPKVMILASLADRRPIDLHIFRNYKSPGEILKEVKGRQSPQRHPSDHTTILSLPTPAPPHQQLVWEAARASGAAPSYFRSKGRFLDGGLIGNNPTLDALTELTELRLALEASGQTQEADKTTLKVVVSCGTGLIPVQRLRDIDVFRPESLWDSAMVARGIKVIGDLLVDQATQSDGRVVDRARAWCSSLGVPYYRFAPQLPSAVGMDERNDQVLVEALWAARVHMRSRRNMLVELAALLTD